jgi:hypothetical protein
MSDDTPTVSYVAGLAWKNAAQAASRSGNAIAARRNEEERYTPMTDANPDSTLKLLSDADDVVEELREFLGEFTAWRADVGQARIVTPTMTLDVLARTTILLESLRTAANQLQKALDGHGTDRAGRGSQPTDNVSFLDGERDEQ